MSLIEYDDYSNINDKVRNLIDWWRTEAHCPDVLPYQHELIDELKQLLESQQAFVDGVIENENKKDGEYFTATLYQMDLDRIRYSLKQYFRIRILKIEDSVEYILSNIVVMDRLSDHEKLFLSKISNLNNYFKEDLILNRVNDEIRELFENSTDVVKHCQPEMNRYVFCLPLQDISEIEIESGEYTSLEAKKVAILKYDCIQKYVFTNQMILL